MDLQRIQIKFYLDDEASISAEDAFRVFNEWIPETSEETLVDVADYSHVPDGPCTLLVGHENNYALDSTDRHVGHLTLAGDETVTLRIDPVHLAARTIH